MKASKKLLVVPCAVLIAATLFGCASMEPVPQDQWTRQEIVEFDGTVENAFQESRVWLSRHADLNVDDPTNAVVAGRIEEEILAPGAVISQLFSAHVLVEVREGRSRITIDDWIHHGDANFVNMTVEERNSNMIVDSLVSFYIPTFHEIAMERSAALLAEYQNVVSDSDDW